MADDDDLRHLLGDAVADVTPNDRLGEIRRRTARPVRRRRWPVVVLGAGTATAAVVAAVALVSSIGTPVEDDAPTARPAERTDAVATYFVGDTMKGDRLFREFQSVPRSRDEADRALEALRRLESGPADPDYRTLWPAGSFVSVETSAALITVGLSDAAADDLASMRTDGLQQVVYTAQAAVARVVPVSFASGSRVLLPDVARDNAVLNALNISDPLEGHTVDDLLTVRGTVRPLNSAIVAVPWSLRSGDGAVALSRRAPITDGAWEQTVDISSLAPGRYVLFARVLDGVDTQAIDTRTITVR